MLKCTLSYSLRGASVIWSSVPGFKGISHWDGHFNWTINFWKDASWYLDECILFYFIFLPSSKFKHSPSDTPLITSSCTLFSPFLRLFLLSALSCTLVSASLQNWIGRESVNYDKQIWSPPLLSKSIIWIYQLDQLGCVSDFGLDWLHLPEPW